MRRATPRCANLAESNKSKKSRASNVSGCGLTNFCRICVSVFARCGKLPVSQLLSLSHSPWELARLPQFLASSTPLCCSRYPIRIPNSWSVFRLIFPASARRTLECRSRNGRTFSNPEFSKMFRRRGSMKII